ARLPEVAVEHLQVVVVAVGGAAGDAQLVEGRAVVRPEDGRVELAGHDQREKMFFAVAPDGELVARDLRVLLRRDCANAEDEEGGFHFLNDILCAWKRRCSSPMVAAAAIFPSACSA